MGKGDFPKAANTNAEVFSQDLNTLGVKMPFGDGSDGALTVSANTSLGKVVKHYTTLTIDHLFCT